jgi:uncharacterized protein YndB with AHSA1/START domain
MKRDLRFEAVYPHPPERVWHALTDRRELAEWLMPNDFLGHKFQFKTKSAPGFDGIVNCEVIEMDPPRRLAYAWRGGKLNSVVSFHSQPVAEGTRLVLEHTGFEGVGDLASLLGSGWKRMLEQRLPAVLDAVSRGASVAGVAPASSIRLPP